jgi:hypothetical protein
MIELGFLHGHEKCVLWRRKAKIFFSPFCRHNVIVTSSIIARPTEKTKNHFAWQDKGGMFRLQKNLNFCNYLISLNIMGVAFIIVIKNQFVKIHKDDFKNQWKI